LTILQKRNLSDWFTSLPNICYCLDIVVVLQHVDFRTEEGESAGCEYIRGDVRQDCVHVRAICWIVPVVEDCEKGPV
jgi:hypothetical protein